MRGLVRVGDGVLYAIHGSDLVAWELDPARLAERACDAAGRTIAKAERQRLGIDADLPVCASTDG